MRAAVASGLEMRGSWIGGVTIAVTVVEAESSRVREDNLAMIYDVRTCSGVSRSKIRCAMGDGW